MPRQEPGILFRKRAVEDAGPYRILFHTENPQHITVLRVGVLRRVAAE